MKARLKLSAVLAFSAVLAACGSGGGSSDSTTQGTSADPGLSGVISGKLTGDIANVSGVEAVRVGDGAKYFGAITSSSNKANALTGVEGNFKVTVPSGASYNLNIVGANKQALATLQFSSNTAGTSTTTKVNVPATTTGTQINMGAVPVPAGVGTGATPTTVVPSLNPLAQVDSDLDGLDDLEDTDDNDDGVDDSTDDFADDSTDGSTDDTTDNSTDDSTDDTSSETETPETPETPEASGTYYNL